MVLIYTPAPEGWAGKLQKTLAVRGVGIKRILPADVGQQVGALAGVKGFSLREDGAGTPPEESVLIFCGMAGAGLDGALTACRTAGVPRGVYKAVVTAENAGWSFADLVQELVQERAAMEER